jgi:hypothetical protein
MQTFKPVPVLFLDLDGTVREGPDDPLGKFVNGPEDVRVFPEAVEQMRRWKDNGGRVLGVTNQGGIALGYVTTGARHRRYLLATTTVSRRDLPAILGARRWGPENRRDHGREPERRFSMGTRVES